MRKAFRHTGVLMMLAVVALGLVGAAYTLWYQKLTLTTNISTGSLSAAWSFHPWSAGTGGEGTFATASSAGNGKPVVAVPTVTLLNGGVATLLGLSGSGSGSANFTWGNFNPPSNIGIPDPVKPPPTCAGAMTGTTLTLTLGGLFPYAGCEFQIDISNTGTVPFHLAVLSTKVQQCDASGPNCGVPAYPNNMPWTRGVVTGSANYAECLALLNADWKGTLPQQVNDSGGHPVQIHPGNDLVCDFMIVLDENWWDGASGTFADPSHWSSNQNLNFTITTTYAAYQWNESPSSTLLGTLP